MRKNHFGILLVLIVVAMFGVFSLGNQKAAAFFTQYCDVLAPPSSPGGGNAANCQNGQNEDALNNLAGLSGQALKNQFIADINGYANGTYNGGYEFQKVGAAYIKAGLQHFGGTWDTNIDQPDVSVAISTSTSCDNTAYYAPSNAVVSTTDCARGLATIKFNQAGYGLVYEVKLDCGNPLGSLGGIHPVPQHWTTNDVASNTAGGGAVLAGTPVTFKQYVHNSGPATATVGYQVTVFDGISSAPFGPYNVISLGAGGNSASYSLYGLTASSNPAVTTECVSIASSPVSDTNPAATSAQSCITVIHPWSLTGTTTASVASLYPGQSVTFPSSIKNNGPGNSGNFAYGPRWFYSATPTPALNAGGFYNGEQPPPVPNGVTTLAAGATLGGITETITVPVGDTADAYICGTVAFAPPNNTGAPANGRSTPASCVRIAHPAPACTFATPSLAAPEPGTPFSVATQVGYGGAGGAADATYVYTNAGGRAYLILKGPNGSATVVYNGTDLTTAHSAAQAFIAGNFAFPTGLPIGQYTLEYGVRGSTIPASNITCPGTPLSIANRPYFDVEGADVAAGAGFNSGVSTCGQTPSAGIKSWNDDNGSGAGYYGAGSQAGAFADGNIVSYITSLNPLANQSTVHGGTAYTLGTPHDLAFANSGGGVSVNDAGQYGGNFGQVACMDDYKTDIGNGPLTSWTNNNTTSGSYNIAGNVTINLPGAITNGTVINLKVNGNVIINAPITYDDSGGPGFFPRLNVVASGNIYVAAGVSEIHGLFVSQGGSFITCASGASELQDYNSCHNQLTVYGSVDATSIHFDRSYSTLNPAAGNPAGQAESFRYGPEFWLATPDCRANPNDTVCTTDGSSTFSAVTALPPVL